MGDILDELNGISVRHFYGSKIESLFKKHKKTPFNITFIKVSFKMFSLILQILVERVLRECSKFCLCYRAKISPLDKYFYLL